MSVAVISLNPDLRRLQDEGYELEVCDGYALVHNVPYLDASRTVQYGVLVSPLTMSGDRVCYQKNACKHIMNFCGSMPYRNTGEPLKEILLDHNTCVVSGVSTNMRFSSKPRGDYNDYYEKFTGYIRILSAEAQAVDPNVTAATFKRIVSSEDSVSAMRIPMHPVPILQGSLMDSKSRKLVLLDWAVQVPTFWTKWPKRLLRKFIFMMEMYFASTMRFALLALRIKSFLSSSR